MKLMDIYSLGTLIPLDFSLKKTDKKLSFVFFPYKAKDIIFTSLIIALFSIIMGNILYSVSPFANYALIFLGIILAIALFVYPIHIFYSHKILEYTEEMLRAILHLSTYIQMGSSMEYSFLETEKNITGILKKEFHDINTSLKRRVVNDLGSAIKKYIEVWNAHNPYFVKSIRLLQISALSEEKERERLIRETIETLIMNYNFLGKRSAEQLSKNTNMLIAGGILIPILSLLILPLLSVFFPTLVKPSIIAFIYTVLFPSIVLIASLSFASQRIQIDTIRITDSIDYKPMPRIFLWIGLLVIVIFSIPTIITVNQVLSGQIRSDEITMTNLFYGWTLGGGIALAVFIYTSFYVRRYKKLWTEIRDVESDLPFILQSFSTYFSLNMPLEKVLDGVVDDYENLGFKDHPVVKMFKTIQRMILTTKETIMEIMSKYLIKIIPSSKVRSIILQIASFESASQESAYRAAKTIRRHVINTYKLDDYIKTLLSDAVSLMNTTITMLAPLLCAAAVIMTFAIVKSIVFITQQLEIISRIFGGPGITLALIDVTKVIPPTFIGVVVGVYLIEMIIILSLFQTQISIGTDYYQTNKVIRGNLIGFLIYTVLLFGGFFMVNVVFFRGLIGN